MTKYLAALAANVEFVILLALFVLAAWLEGAYPAEPRTVELEVCRIVPDSDPHYAGECY